MTTLPTYFLSHGGGPWPYMDGPFRENFTRLEAHLRGLLDELPQRPKAILMVSGHWEERDFTVGSSPRPPMVYDYYNFPPHTYEVQYTSPGSPELAARVKNLLEAGGVSCVDDTERGYDHGMFSVMEPLRPEADIPVVQLSIRRDYDPAAHIAIGRLLAPLRDEGVLILGSGLSYHNLRAFGPVATEPSAAFDAWLQQVLVDGPVEQREAALERWAQAPGARFCHPREDHLIPLMVAAGAAMGDAGTCPYHEVGFLGGITASSFRFG